MKRLVSLVTLIVVVVFANAAMAADDEFCCGTLALGPAAITSKHMGQGNNPASGVSLMAEVGSDASTWRIATALNVVSIKRIGYRGMSQFNMRFLPEFHQGVLYTTVGLQKTFNEGEGFWAKRTLEVVAGGGFQKSWDYTTWSQTNHLLVKGWYLWHHDLYDQSQRGSLQRRIRGTEFGARLDMTMGRHGIRLQAMVAPVLYDQAGPYSGGDFRPISGARTVTVSANYLLRITHRP